MTICPVTAGYKEDILQVRVNCKIVWRSGPTLKYLKVFLKAVVIILNKTLFQQHNISNVKEYNNGRNRDLKWSSNDTSVDQQTLFKNVTYEFDEIVKRIYVRYIKTDENGKANEDIDFKGKSTSIKEQRHRVFGRCYTLYPEKRIRDLSVYYIKAWL